MKRWRVPDYRFTLCSGLICLLVMLSACNRADGVTALACAQAAVAQMAQGETREAAKQVRQAVQIAPDNADVSDLAGTLLLTTGDYSEALAAFRNALASDPKDSLALYGQGLAQLARGERRAAQESFDNAERYGGNPTHLRIVQNYARWLGGTPLDKPGNVETPGLQAAFQGMTAVAQGDRNAAIRALEAAQSATPGDPILQPEGPLLTFDTAHPLNTGQMPLPANHGLNPEPGREQGVSGDVLFTPEGLTPSVAYVAYEVDGQALSLIGLRPFQYAWDSRTVSNGWHTLVVTLFDRNAQEIRRVTKQYRVANRSAAPPADAERWKPVREALWQALTPRLDRCACAYTLGQLYRAQGQIRPAEVWFARTVAIRPDYRDARRQLADCGGLPTGNPAIYTGLPGEKVVALTFDDGPKPGVTEPLLELLQEQHITATFFVIGRHVMEYPDLTRKIADAGMELANHSYTHPDLTQLSPEEATRELLETQAAILTVTGKTPRFMRPPGGNWSGSVADIVRHWGLTPCMWTVDAFNSEVIGTQQVVQAVLQGVRPGSIILMHNGKVSTLQALPAILRELKARGYTFVTIETLVQRLDASKSAARPASGPSPHRGE